MSAAGAQGPSLEEREQLRQVTRALLEARSDLQAVRARMDAGDGDDPGLWAELAGLGLAGLTVPERLGGSGATWAEVAIVAEEVGRHLAPVPYLATVGLGLVPLLSDAEHDETVKGVAAGTTTLALAAGLSSRSTPGGTVLDGHAAQVLGGHTADAVVAFAADADGGRSAYLVDASAVRREVEPSLDLTRPLASLHFDGAAGRLIGSAGAGEQLLATALAAGRTVLACEAVGGAQRCLELSVEHARTRLQFGRPIGSFQAVKHRCARMLADVELARALTERAVTALARGDDDAGTQADLALECTGAAFERVAKDTIQVHGGIGFTWEHAAHLYLKRAVSVRRLLGGARQRRRRLAQALGL